MKNIKFSRLFAAVAFVAVLALAGCKQQVEEPKKIEGTWVSSWGEKFVISGSEVKNYYGSSLCYAGNLVEINEINDKSGIVYFKYTRAYEKVTTEPNPSTGWTHAAASSYGPENWYRYSETAPDVGNWYALSYVELTDKSVRICGASKVGGKTSCPTLAEAKTEFTVLNKYFPESNYSTCVKQ